MCCMLKVWQVCDALHTHALDAHQLGSILDTPMSLPGGMARPVNNVLAGKLWQPPVSHSTFLAALQQLLLVCSDRMGAGRTADAAGLVPLHLAASPRWAPGF